MREIRKLNEEHIDAYIEIAFNAYPSFKDFSTEGIEKYKKTALEIMKNDPIVTFYGMFENDKLVAVMRLFDFQMNFFGKIIPVSGLGFLGVHLMHKKQKIARALVEFYEEHYRSRGVNFGLLLPFRPDFYKKMGYGLGTKMNQYRIATDKIPAYTGKSNLRYIKKEDYDKLLQCHARAVERTHGMIMKFGDEIRNLYDDEFDRIIGNYDEKGNINGYIVYKFQNGKSGNYTINNIYVKEIIYENSEVLRILLGFLRKQEDQVNLVIFNTEDEHFHYLFDNPLNDTMNYIPFGYLETNTQAVGVMYKIFDIKNAFRQNSHRNYNNVNLNVRFVITDEYKNNQETIVSFEKGRCSVDSDVYDVTVSTRISEFSALFMGCTSVKALHDLGLLEIDDKAYLCELDRAFYCSQKPVCYTDF